ncbi:hypothetical protein VTL71DRAFT_3783 [Oculimacula yallundae]|uniref:Uncharacterized protein n=1 Tax=Oculimacula yallundae TaxID=86028 RepID=A0ABR4C4Q4_9HELO
MNGCQDIRDAYGSTEDDCIAMRKKLSRPIVKRNSLDRPYFMQDEEPYRILLATPLIGELPNIMVSRLRNRSFTSSREDCGESLYHPLVTRYLAKFWRILILLQRRHAGLSDEKCSFEAKKISRARFGMVLDVGNQAWLGGSQARYDTLVDEVYVFEKYPNPKSPICKMVWALI